MLSTAARARLRDVLPHENKPPDLRGFDISWTPSSGTTRETTIVPEVTWRSQGDEPDYPIIVLDADPDGVHRTEALPLDEIIRREAVPQDPTIAYREYRGEPLYSILSVTVAVEANRLGGIPRTVVARDLAQQVYAYYRFETDHLRRQGDDAYEWPLIVRPTTEGVRHLPDEDGAVDRYHMQFRVDYELTQATLVEALKDFTYDIEITQ